MKTHNLKTQFFINVRKLTKPAALCLCALIILSTLSFFAVTTVQAATVTPFGNSAVGTVSDQNDANAQSISYFKCTTSGAVTDIIAYISGASSGNCIAALYAVNGNSAGALLAQSNAANIGTTFSWVDLQLPTPYTVTSGTTYGLAIMGNVPVNIRIVSGTGQRTGGPGYSSYAKGFTNPFGTIWFNDPTGAMSIYATGTGSTNPTPTPTPTSTPTPTPTTTPNPLSSSNLAAIPDDWGGYSRGYGITYSSVIPPSQPQITALDTSVLFNGQPSVRIDPYVSPSENGNREVDAEWVAAKPGDHVVFSCWMKTSRSTLGYNGVTGYGARIGISFYGSGGFINDMQYAGAYTKYPTYQQVINAFVPWNTATWTLRTLDFIVPSVVYDLNGNPQTPNGVYPWMQALIVNDGGQAWFAGATLYVTP